MCEVFLFYVCLFLKNLQKIREITLYTLGVLNNNKKNMVAIPKISFTSILLTLLYINILGHSLDGNYCCAPRGPVLK